MLANHSCLATVTEIFVTYILMEILQSGLIKLCCARLLNQKATLQLRADYAIKTSLNHQGVKYIQYVGGCGTINAKVLLIKYDRYYFYWFP